MSKQAFKRVRRILGLEVNRKQLPAFAWPGGYPIVYVFADGGVACATCANEFIDDIDTQIREHNRLLGGWRLDDWMIHWEGEPLVCDNCGGEIESAYGPVDAES